MLNRMGNCIPSVACPTPPRGLLVHVPLQTPVTAHRSGQKPTSGKPEQMRPKTECRPCEPSCGRLRRLPPRPRELRGAFLMSGRPRGTGTALKNVGAKPPTFLQAFPGSRGRPDFKNAPQKSGQTAFRYPAGQGCGEQQKKEKQQVPSFCFLLPEPGDTSGRRCSRTPGSPGPGFVGTQEFPGFGKPLAELSRS
jgi:hypothetical protein